MFLFRLAFLLPGIQIEGIITALGMICHKIGCVSISVITLFFVWLLAEREESVHGDLGNCVPVWLTLFPPANELFPFLEL